MISPLDNVKNSCNYMWRKTTHYLMIAGHTQYWTRQKSRNYYTMSSSYVVKENTRPWKKANTHGTAVSPESLFRFVHRPPTGHCRWSLSIRGKAWRPSKHGPVLACKNDEKSWHFHGFMVIFLEKSGLILKFIRFAEVWWEIRANWWSPLVIQCNWDLMGGSHGDSMVI